MLCAEPLFLFGENGLNSRVWLEAMAEGPLGACNTVGAGSFCTNSLNELLSCKQTPDAFEAPWNLNLPRAKLAIWSLNPAISGSLEIQLPYPHPYPALLHITPLLSALYQQITWTSHKLCFKNLFFELHAGSLVLLFLHSLCSTQPTRAAGSNETDFAPSRSISPDGWRLADVLMVATTEGMFYRLWERKSGR